MKTSCFFCVPIMGGAKFVALITLLSYTFIAVDLYTDVIKYQQTFLNILDHPILQAIYGDSEEGMTERLNWRKDADYFFGSYVTVGIFGYSIIQVAMSFLMLCGLQCHKRGLLMPHIVINTIKSSLEITLAISITILTIIAVNWYANIISFWLPLTLFVLSIANIYFQLEVSLRAYVKMGTTNYNAKPINYGYDYGSKDTSYQNFKGELYI